MHQWQARQAALERAKAQVHALHQRNVPIRAIARQTGRSRSTIDIWLQQPVPDLDPSEVVTLLEEALTHQIQTGMLDRNAVLDHMTTTTETPTTSQDTSLRRSLSISQLQL
ncbi:MAG TPA: helix-turn-helix domain-containing protein [Roseiflexaceae bacterium]|nr:helix-turn-helix domain-containing protein [Roseiflexaceae bacterium]